MSKFKEALERGKKAHHRQDESADGNARKVDFGAQARDWLMEVVVASLEAAKADVAGEVTIDIDPIPRPEDSAIAPSVEFRISGNGTVEKNHARAFKVSVSISGEASVCAPGTVAEDIGSIGDKSDQRFRHLLARLIEDAARGA
ncbi:hypothetical protein LB534_26130 [Mesorhizobium sp. CA18]|uniref:hypothetical protein n=1 Tax=unclassified Mesorhizobium TaxID=325217 RepID=UPI001CCB462F|nr:MULTISPECIES: hypothetical protein [unclassified Mesorhizobium]MBZ9735005.1 hypothetical protein [Mesorhizobium sp. CA9]MBZ9828779.1 hypothetical protein [Mesorhizobium sp. CA18]MBZ9834281.1 hypothetical protein [Mesorhizobium sp. CA2]MBZ9838870.1 hypothetical protein [Mesorhizobium sp. CA3]MBZ9880083.1 hypothetical protein [Mesorhizobium sp. Ca11]